MEGIIMTLKQIVPISPVNRTIRAGIILTLVAIPVPVAARETIVEGSPSQRSNLLQERVEYADLDLRNQSNQRMLMSRVRHASNRVCDIAFRGESPMVKFTSRCPQRIYRESKPQIDLAIANAQNGKRVAVSFVVAASR